MLFMEHVKRDSLAPYWQHILTKCSLRHQDIAVFFYFYFYFFKNNRKAKAKPPIGTFIFMDGIVTVSEVIYFTYLLHDYFFKFRCKIRYRVKHARMTSLDKTIKS